MKKYTIKLTDEQDKALRHVAADPQAWIENAVFVRCEAAKAELVGVEIERMIADPETASIPADKDEIVRNAKAPSAAERNAAMASAMIQSFT